MSFPRFKKQYLIFALLLIGGAALGYGFSKYNKAQLLSMLGSKPERVLPYTYDENISESAQNLFGDDNALFSYVKKFGPKKATAYLATFPSCHDVAHRAGRMAYELFDAEEIGR